MKVIPARTVCSQNDVEHHSYCYEAVCYINSVQDQRKTSIFAIKTASYPFFFFYTNAVPNITDSPACAARDTQPILSQFAR